MGSVFVYDPLFITKNLSIVCLSVLAVIIVFVNMTMKQFAFMPICKLCLFFHLVFLQHV